MNEWYRDRVDGFWTFDLDPNFNGYLQVDWEGYWTSPVSGATAQTPVSEGGTVAISEVSANDSRLIFRVAGSGALVTFRVAYGSGESDDLTLRFRSKQR